VLTRVVPNCTLQRTLIAFAPLTGGRSPFAALRENAALSGSCLPSAPLRENQALETDTPFGGPLSAALAGTLVWRRRQRR